MNIALSDIILYVTGKQGIENTSQETLQAMVAEYPYFAPAQLVYAAKLKNENSFKLQTQVQKTGLFFNNFKWLQYQLLEAAKGGFSSNIPSKPSEELNIALPVEQPIVEEELMVAQQSVIAEAANVVESAETIAIPEFEQYDVAETISKNAHQFMPNLSIPTVEDVKDMMSGIDERREEEPIAEIGDGSSNREGKTIEENVIVGNDNENDFLATENNFDEVVTMPIANHSVEESVSVQNDIHAEIAALKANWYAKNETQNVEETSEILETAEIKNVDPLTDKNVEALKNEWQQPLSQTEPLLPIDIEPYYTIDYFASQGIKFDYTKEPQDKLTVKMLKFTDWLKKMKTPKQETRVVDEDPELDKTIQNIADASNQSKEIVTETMAEIFAKQGKTDKAIQLYIKLSFLIPHKSAYFATKLNELKGI